MKNVQEARVAKLYYIIQGNISSLFISNKFSESVKLIVLKNDNNFQIFTPNEKYKELLKNIKNGGYNNEENWNKIKPYLTDYMNFRNNIHSFILKYPDFFNNKQVNLNQLYSYIKQNFLLDDISFKKLYGALPDHGNEPDNINNLSENKFIYGKTIVYFPEGSSEKTKNLIKSVIDKFHSILDSKQMGFLIEGNVFFKKKIPKGLAGYCEMSSGNIVVGIENLKDKDSLTTLIHELGHRFEIKIGKEIVINKYKELKEQGNSYFRKVRFEEYIGDTFINTSNNPVYKDYRDIDFKLIKITDGYALLRFNKNGIELNRSISLNSLVPHTTTENGSIWYNKTRNEPISNESKNKWFVSPYSEKNYSEWFAELFVDYIKGKTDEEVNNWFKSIH